MLKNLKEDQPVSQTTEGVVNAWSRHNSCTRRKTVTERQAGKRIRDKNHL